MNTLSALITTIVIEYIIILIFLREKPYQLLLYTILINAFTQPLATMGYYYLIGSIVLIEILVFCVEIPLIMILIEIEFNRALKISFIANGITALTSIIM